MSEMMSQVTQMARRFIAKARIGQSYRIVFTSPVGEVVLHDILRRGGVLEAVTEPGDSHMSAFRDGRRSLALEIIQEMRWNEQELVRLAEKRTADELSIGAE